MGRNLATMLVLSGLLLTMVGCGGGSSSGPTPGLPIGNPAFLYQGVSVTPWSQNDLTGPSFLNKLAKLQGDGVNSVAINQWLFQDNASSSTISLDFAKYSCSDASLVVGIQEAHAAGMSVILKPQVDLRDGNWRGTIPASAAWFTAYKAQIVHYAQMAASNHVEMLSVGTEYNANQGDDASWRSVIAAVRAVYSGKLVYSCNFDSYQALSWWDALDEIGIDAYFPLSTVPDPPQDTLNANAITIRDTINNWRLTHYPTKHIAFTETGFYSRSGTSVQPWTTNSGALDLTEQANCYSAWLAAFSNQSWFDGMFWWNWTATPGDGGVTDTNYTSEGKPAELIMKSANSIGL